MKTAIVLGATGLTGSQLVQQLLADSRFSKVKVFVRRSMGVNNPKLEEYIVNFDVPAGWQQYVSGDVLYSAMGTTIKVAGSQDAQYKIDYTYQYQMAQIAAANGVPQYVLISASGASATSRIFYSRIKGELEQAVKLLPFKSIHILQPGMLSGNRKEMRMGERIGIPIMNFISFIPGLGALKPIDVSLVARAMINASFKEAPGSHIYNMGGVFVLAGK